MRLKYTYGESSYIMDDSVVKVLYSDLENQCATLTEQLCAARLFKLFHLAQLLPQRVAQFDLRRPQIERTARIARDRELYVALRILNM